MVQTDVAQTEKSHTDFDLFVIGGGSGGVRAARIAATHGARVGIAEEYRYGGTCVIRGCVPKKLYVYASRFAEAFSTSRAFGWQPGEAAFSWPDLVGAKEQEITRLENIYADNLKKSGVRVFQERAQFVDAHTVKLTTSGDTIKAGKFLIATGGRPSMDTSIPGHEYAISSNEAFDLPKLPRQIVIYGGGYIAVEFAGIFSGLGVETTLVYRGQQFLRGFDDDMRDHVETAYRNRGVNIVYGQTIQAIEKDGEAYLAKLSGGESVACDQVMFAIGRLPNTDGLGLDSAGVETSKKGAIQVDDSSKTNVDHIYAVGDVTDRVQLTPVAIREGHAFADTVFGQQPWATDYDMIPTAVFSTPEIGTVGMPEHTARATYPKLDVYKSSFRPMKSVLAGKQDKTLMKLLVDGASDRIVGCHVAGDDAAEMVQSVAIAMRMGATKADFDSTMALHPSAAEELVTMRTKAEPTAQAAE